MKHSFVLSKILSFISPGQLKWEHIDSLCHRVAVCLYIKHVVHFHWPWTLYRYLWHHKVGLFRGYSVLLISLLTNNKNVALSTTDLAFFLKWPLM